MKSLKFKKYMKKTVRYRDGLELLEKIGLK